MRAVVEYLRDHKRVSEIGLWGRSMGVAAALMYMKQYPGTVACSVLDSGFSSLKVVMDDLFDALTDSMGLTDKFRE